jgi:hypothetical protein
VSASDVAWLSVMVALAVVLVLCLALSVQEPAQPLIAAIGNVVGGLVVLGLLLGAYFLCASGVYWLINAGVEFVGTCG